jgi:tRNA-dihydrouridine synthase
MNAFWESLPGPFTILAPMDGVTDVVFRQIITEIGKPDVLFTEFTMTDGLVSKAREKVAERLMATDIQKPVVAQIWGTKPENFYAVAKELKNLGFAGIDINMGCPVKDVTNRGACSALIKTPELAAAIIQAAKEGAGDLPVSVKTRLGFEKVATETWIAFLLEQKLPALTIHLRTVRELSKVPAHWEEMVTIMKLRERLAPKTIIIGNGDIMSIEEIDEKYKQYGCEGFMVGRGIFANPWFFNKNRDLRAVIVDERIALYLQHIILFEKQWGRRKNFALLKKFAKTYIQNFPEASILREKLMETKTLEELKSILRDYSLHKSSFNILM